MANGRKKFENKLNISGEQIRKCRKACKMSREKLSAKLLIEEGIDISAQSIANIEVNVRTVVDYELCAIAKILNVDVAMLLQDYYDKDKSDEQNDLQD